MSMGVEIQGTTRAIAFLNSKKNQIENKAKQGLTNAALFIQGEVKSSIAGQRAEPTSVDTGRFLNSVGVEIGNDTAKVFSDLEYAKFLEYGTTRLSARRHFNNTKDRNQQKVQEIIEQAIKQI